jgi:hypothetical protein
MYELHDGPARGNYNGDTTAHKILKVGYYWNSLFKDAHAYAMKCQQCQTATGREKKVAFPLQPIINEHPFKQWGLEVIEEINPKSS